MQRITGIVHDHDQAALVARDEVYASSDLGDIGRGEDVAAYGGVEQTWAYEARMGGLVA